MNEELRIYVYDSFSSDTDVLMGRLYVNYLRGTESYSFEYDPNWLAKHPNIPFLDPALQFFEGRQYPLTDSMFGIFSDASPDRWGRVLMKKKERNLSDKENRKPRKLNDSDFLLGVYDETRMGGLRFKVDPEEEFLSDDQETATPPWTTLRTLEEASRELENADNALNEKWINQLIRPGSSLGGARPKATVADPNRNLWIAKFPSKNDENNTGAWEKVASDLAKLCGLDVPESKLETFSKLGGTFLVKRFDRIGSKRIHFASAMTLLGKTDGASAQEGVGYLDIASFIKSYGSNPKQDLLELWKRIVFNMAISNTDDHLRNHAFIFTDHGWKLSPLFDVNPVPYGDTLALNVSSDENSISIPLAISVANLFGLSGDEAKMHAEKIVSTVQNNWEKTAIGYAITRAQIEEMRPAFI